MSIWQHNRHRPPWTLLQTASVTHRQMGVHISAGTLADRVKAEPATWGAEAGKSTGDLCKHKSSFHTDTSERLRQLLQTLNLAVRLLCFYIKAQRTVVFPSPTVNSVTQWLIWQLGCWTLCCRPAPERALSTLIMTRLVMRAPCLLRSTSLFAFPGSREDREKHVVLNTVPLIL